MSGINWAATMSEYGYLLSIALILLFSKVFGLIIRRLGFPQVLGAIIAGLILGPLCLGWVVDTENQLFKFLAEIGVIMILFSAGIETNLKDIKKNGIPSIVITICGVVFPVGLGFIVAACFNGGFVNMTGQQALQNTFYGVILAATSVSISVEALKELGKLKSKVGNSIVAAAILDDIIGIIILAVVLSFHSGEVSVGTVFLNFLYFALIVTALGVICYYFFKWMEKKNNHTRRIPIFGLVMCFAFSFIAQLFGIADITGAYIAGLILSGFKNSSEYVERKIDINSYMFFSPIFFAYIGISISTENFDLSLIWFGIALVAIGLVSKIVGCGLGARVCGYSNMDSLRVGIGMMSRGEVALIVAQKGVDYGLIDSSYMPVIIILIVASSILTPIFLKLTYRKSDLLVPPYESQSNIVDNINVRDALDGFPIITRKKVINNPQNNNKPLKLHEDYSSFKNGKIADKSVSFKEPLNQPSEFSQSDNAQSSDNGSVKGLNSDKNDTK